MGPSSTFQGGASGVLAPPRPVRTRSAGPPRLPPNDPGDGGRGPRGGGGGEDGDVARFGMALALCGIFTLFLVLIAVWLFLRRPAQDWSGNRPQAALHILWASTALLLASSATVERAARRAPRDPEGRHTRRWLGVSLALGTLFLVTQVALWALLWKAGLVPSSSGYAAVFFALTGLHALHVLGGLLFFASLYLALSPRRAGPRPSVRMGAVYWHFMGAVWLVLFTLLYFVR